EFKVTGAENHAMAQYGLSILAPIPPLERAHLDTATGHSRRNSLSSKKWRRGLGRGGAFEHSQSACFAETDRPLPNPLPLLRRERGRKQRWQCRDAPLWRCTPLDFDVHRDRVIC